MVVDNKNAVTSSNRNYVIAQAGVYIFTIRLGVRVHDTPAGATQIALQRTRAGASTEVASNIRFPEQDLTHTVVDMDGNLTLQELPCSIEMTSIQDCEIADEFTVAVKVRSGGN